jgi:membrane protease YdiL (CAAX protease family)
VPQLTVPSIDTTTADYSPAYVPRSGWPAWAVLPAGVVIFGISAALGVLGSVAAALMLATGSGLPPPAELPPGVIVAGLSAQQIGMILLTLLFAGFFATRRAETLALRPPRGGWGVLPLALIPLFGIIGIWTALLMWWQPDVVIGDLRLFANLLQGEMGIIALIAIGIGAPLSEELLFRGFLFSGLAKSRLGLLGTGILTTVLWTTLHYGYSIFGLIEVLAIGLYFAWLLVRTGSLWVPMFCHAVYNTVIGLVLYFVALPPPV